MELPENLSINENVIKLVDGKKLSYEPIYILSLVKLDTLNTYIKTHPKTGFIQLSKSSTDIPILFDKKSYSNLYLCMDYQSLNNLTITNR